MTLIKNNAIKYVNKIKKDTDDDEMVDIDTDDYVGNVKKDTDEEEIWEDSLICPVYEISNFGNIRNKKTLAIKKTFVRQNKRIWTRLCNVEKNSNNKEYPVDYIILQTFSYDKLKQIQDVVHIDGIISNNNIENLKWKEETKLDTTWKIIDNYENHEVSDKGEVRNVNTMKKLTLRYKKGYLEVTLTSTTTGGRTTQYVHRLVAIMFISNPEKSDFIDHIDHNRSNNNFSNLRWATVIENNNNKIQKNDQRIYQKNLKGEEIKIWKSAKEIEKVLKFSRVAILHCCKGKTKTSNGFTWSWFIVRIQTNNPSVKKIEDITNYKSIGIIDNYDFSNYKICQNPEISIINKNNNKMVIGTSESDKRKSYNVVNIVDSVTSKGITIFVHRLIYAINNKNHFPTKKEGVVDHIDNDKTNNNIDNLQLITSKANTVKSCGKKVSKICIKTNEIITTFDTISEAALSLGNIKGARGHISQVCGGQRKTAYGFKWQYA